MASNKTKLIAAACMLLLALVLIVVASFAWFTVSTAPEITGMVATLNTDETLLVSDSQDGTYDNTLVIALADFAPLLPVSTVDGENWFIATYDEDLASSGYGMLLDTEDFVLYQHTEVEEDFDLAYLLAEDGTLDGIESTSELYREGYANVLLKTDDASGSDGDDGNGAGGSDGAESDDAAAVYGDTGYYIYFDIWLMTEDDACDVYLSIPSYDSDKGSYILDSYEEEIGSQVYGTYALANYAVYETGDGDDTAYTAEMQRNAQTALRVGFQTTTSTADENGDETDSTNFVIYEPNADQRNTSGGDEKPALTAEEEAEIAEAALKDETLSILTVDNEYIKDGYQINSDGTNYLAGQYIPTLPVMLVQDEVSGDGGDDGDGGDVTYSFVTTTLIGEDAPTTTQLIIQTQSSWDTTDNADGDPANEAAFIQAYQQSAAGYTLADGETWRTGWSDVVQTMGMFVLDNAALVSDELTTSDIRSDDVVSIEEADGTGLGVYDLSYSEGAQSSNLLNASGVSANDSGTKIVHLTKDTPQKVTIYIWIEGQDADCWNDIAAGSFVVNLELAGQN